MMPWKLKKEHNPWRILGIVYSEKEDAIYWYLCVFAQQKIGQISLSWRWKLKVISNWQSNTKYRQYWNIGTSCWMLTSMIMPGDDGCWLCAKPVSYFMKFCYIQVGICTHQIIRNTTTTSDKRRNENKREETNEKKTVASELSWAELSWVK